MRFLIALVAVAIALAGTVAAETLPAPKGKPFLEITGKISIVGQGMVILEGEQAGIGIPAGANENPDGVFAELNFRVP